jgi:hypothetical protein
MASKLKHEELHIIYSTVHNSCADRTCPTQIRVVIPVLNCTSPRGRMGSVCILNLGSRWK